MPKETTPSVAEQADRGDALFLGWLADRLVHVYSESENVDFVLATRRIAARLASQAASHSAPVESKACASVGAVTEGASDHWTTISRFLTDVMTAAGLVEHGKQCKALAERMSADAAALRTALYNNTHPAPAAAVPEKWIDDPHDIEQGQMLNPEWLRLHGITAQQATQAPAATEAPSLREACAALLSLIRRDAPHLSGKVLGEAEAALAAPAAASTKESAS